MNQQVTTVTTTTMYSSLENVYFYDDFQDVSLGEKRIVRVGTKTFDKTSTYITVKLYKKNEDGVFKCYQAVTLTTREFDCLADNYSKITKLVKKQTGEKTSSSSSSSSSPSSSSSCSAVNDKHHKRRYTSKRAVRPEKECAESGDENDADDEYSNNKKCRVA